MLETGITMPGEIILGALVAKMEGSVKLVSHHTTGKSWEDRRKWKLITDSVFKDCGCRILRHNDVLMTPRAEGPSHLHIREENLSGSSLMDEFPGYWHRPELEPELLPVPWPDSSVRGNDTNIDPGRRQSLECSRTPVPRADV
ncbi:MAG: hypothetical protein C4345_01595, partial [Chloroflexota bacterium]